MRNVISRVHLGEHGARRRQHEEAAVPRRAGARRVQRRVVGRVAPADDATASAGAVARAMSERLVDGAGGPARGGGRRAVVVGRR